MIFQGFYNAKSYGLQILQYSEEDLCDSKPQINVPMTNAQKKINQRKLYKKILFIQCTNRKEGTAAGFFTRHRSVLTRLLLRQIFELHYLNHPLPLFAALCKNQTLE